MTKPFLFLLLIAVLALSCSKNGDEANTYIVSAPKMIAVTSNDWSASEPQLRGKTGYKYTKAPEGLSIMIKAAVGLVAVDDSNRTVAGSILINIDPDNRISYAAFDTGPLAKADAYAMLLNYNNKTLQTVSGISFSIGDYSENGMGANTSVTAVLDKASNAHEAEHLAVIYNTDQGRFSMVVFQQSDGRYTFSYRGNR